MPPLACSSKKVASSEAMTDRVREYEQLSGITVDAERVRYCRLNAFGRLGPWFGLPSMGRRGAMDVDDAAPIEVNRAADGSALILSMLHRRMRLDATSDAMGLDRPPREVEEAPEPAHAAMYDRILEQLRAMVPRTEDRNAASSAKAIARQLKYLRELDRSGELFGRQELDDLGRLLGRTPSSLDEGRAALLRTSGVPTISPRSALTTAAARLVRARHRPAPPGTARRGRVRQSSLGAMGG